MGFSVSNRSAISLNCVFLVMQWRLYFPTKSSNVSSPSRPGNATVFFFWPGLPPCRETHVDMDLEGLDQITINITPKKIYSLIYMFTCRLYRFVAIVESGYLLFPITQLHDVADAKICPKIFCQKSFRERFILFFVEILCVVSAETSFFKIFLGCPVPSINSSNSRCFWSPFLWMVSVEKIYKKKNIANLKNMFLFWKQASPHRPSPVLGISCTPHRDRFSWASSLGSTAQLLPLFYHSTRGALPSCQSLSTSCSQPNSFSTPKISGGRWPKLQGGCGWCARQLPDHSNGWQT